MLSWTQQADGWYAEGFRIELRGPFQWVLVDLEADVDAAQVTTDLEPLATERTLSQCKREAELLSAARHRSLLRGRQVRTLLVVIAAAVLLLGQSPPTDILVILVVGLVATRSLGVIVGTYTWNTLGRGHEVFYQ